MKRWMFLVTVGACKPCELVCSRVPVAQAGWDERVVGPERASGSLTAAAGFQRVVRLGDHDGDGSGDVAVLDGGVVRVFSGAALVAGDVGPGDASSEPTTGAEGLAAVGDVDGDGLGDLAAGDRDAWEVFTAAGRLASIQASGGGRLVAVAGGEDVDGDGVTDVLASQWLVADGRDREEISLLPSLAGGGDHPVASGTPGFGAVVDLDRDHSLALLGDFDGDGRSEVAAGAARNFAAVHPAADWGSGPFGGLSSKEVHLHSCWPDGDGCSSWVEVAGPGDVDGDGLADLIALGRAPASAWLIPGSDLVTDPYKTKAFGGTLASRREILGAEGLVGVGDVDGLTDEAGAPYADLVATRGDRAWLIHGNQLTAQPALDLAEAVHELAGFTDGPQVLVFASGDLDGDGRDDLLVGDAQRLWVVPAPPPSDGEVVYERVCEEQGDGCRP